MGAGAGIGNVIAMIAIGLSLAACAGSSGPRGSDLSGFGKSRGYYKVGAPYQINGVWYYPRVDFSYDQTGTASWYGEAFQGKPTANGEIFDLTQVSAAHKTLQLPSVVEVTNLQNGRALEIRVNDRGPFAGDRIIDLSRRAAQLLGFERAGTAPVRVRIMKAESIQVAEAAMRGDSGQTRLAQAIPTVQTRVASVPPRASVRAAAASARIAGGGAATQVPAPKPEVPMPAADQAAPAVGVALATPASDHRLEPSSRPIDDEVGRRAMWPSLIPSARAATGETAFPPRQQTRATVPSGRIFVQIGAFAQMENAQRIRARVAALGSTEVARVSASGTALYRVRLGPVGSEADARRLIERLTERDIRGARIVAD
jgi:rare lipoprotein A